MAIFWESDSAMGRVGKVPLFVQHQWQKPWFLYKSVHLKTLKEDLEVVQLLWGQWLKPAKSKTFIFFDGMQDLGLTNRRWPRVELFLFSWSTESC